MKLRLCKGLSYSGIVKATKSNPVVGVQPDEAAYLLETGYFVEVPGTDEDEEMDEDDVSFSGMSGSEQPEQSHNSENAENDKSLEKLSKSELEAYAETVGIDIAACKNNGERAEVIKAALAQKNGTSENIEPDFAQGM